MIRPKIICTGVPRRVSVTYTAVLDVSEDSVLFLSGLLHAERVRRGTRTGSRALSTYKQAVLVLRWLFDDTRMIQLARDNDISVSTAYDYRDEAITVLAAGKPSLHGALLALVFRSSAGWCQVRRSWRRAGDGQVRDLGG